MTEHSLEEQLKKKLMEFDRKPPGHAWEKIEKELNFSHPHQVGRWVFAVIAAAVILLLLFLSNLFTPFLGQDSVYDPEKYARGQELFRNMCAACHSRDMEMDLTGPKLKGVTKKYDREWLYAFTRNSYQMIAAGDSLAVRIWKEWKPTVMSSFPNLTDEELDDIYYYVEKKSE